MKLHAERIAHLNTVTAYGPGYIDVNGVRHHGNLILLPDTPVQAWNVECFESLRPEDFDALMASRPEVILFGTGRSQRFAPPRLTGSLLRARVALEAMDTRAACRTFNILVSDGRRVAGAILQEPAQA